MMLTIQICGKIAPAVHAEVLLPALTLQFRVLLDPADPALQKTLPLSAIAVLKLQTLPNM
jgi:hypothetical protein